jgi:hypothetical protein
VSSLCYSVNIYLVHLSVTFFHKLKAFLRIDNEVVYFDSG